jgi:hypothetical protein
MGGTGDDGRWLSYAQLAEARGITRKAAIRMTQRHRWRRQPGNDGTALVWVPEGDLTSRQASRQTPHPAGDGDGDGDTPGKDRLIEALRTDLTEANRRASDAVSLADRLTAQLAGAGERTDRTLALLADAERVLTAERQRADAMRERLDETQHDLAAAQAFASEASLQADQARGAAQEAQDAADALRRADEARKARGRWARLRAAWRGE